VKNLVKLYRSVFLLPNPRWFMNKHCYITLFSEWNQNATSPSTAFIQVTWSNHIVEECFTWTHSLPTNDRWT